MPVLIASRAVQGLGAGAIQPMSLTIVGDLYSVEERAKVQGYLASVWGMSSVIGPTLGGVFSEYVSWRWIFFVNIPICILAAGMIQRRFREDVRRTASARRLRRRRPAHRRADPARARRARGRTGVGVGLAGRACRCWRSAPCC